MTNGITHIFTGTCCLWATPKCLSRALNLDANIASLHCTLWCRELSSPAVCRAHCSSLSEGFALWSLQKLFRIVSAIHHGKAGGVLYVLDQKLKGLRPSLDQKLKGRWRKSRSPRSFSPMPLGDVGHWCTDPAPCDLFCALQIPLNHIWHLIRELLPTQMALTEPCLIGASQSTRHVYCQFSGCGMQDE